MTKSGWITCKNERGRKIHESRKHKNAVPPDSDNHVLGMANEQDFQYRLADKAVRTKKMKKAQAGKPCVMCLFHCGIKTLENVFIFKYLGTMFAADGMQIHDINRRIALAKTRCGQLRHIFASPIPSTHLKLRLYDAAVCSIFTYGCETWDLTPAVMRKINGANSVMLSHITGKSIRAEARPQTTSLNLLRKIRFRRFRWLGHILRTPTHRLIHKALAVQLRMRSPGNLFLDAPHFRDLQELREKAQDPLLTYMHVLNS